MVRGERGRRGGRREVVKESSLEERMSELEGKRLGEIRVFQRQELGENKKSRGLGARAGRIESVNRFGGNAVYALIKVG